MRAIDPSAPATILSAPDELAGNLLTTGMPEALVAAAPDPDPAVLTPAVTVAPDAANVVGEPVTTDPAEIGTTTTTAAVEAPPTTVVVAERVVKAEAGRAATMETVTPTVIDPTTTVLVAKTVVVPTAPAPAPEVPLLGATMVPLVAPTPAPEEFVKLCAEHAAAIARKIVENCILVCRGCC